jgi:tetratricopeptide (TPR) repeat protein
LLKGAGQFDEAIKAYRQALAVWKKLVVEFNHDDRRTHLSWTAGSLGATLQTANKPAEAEQVYRETLAAYGKTPGIGGAGYGLVLQSLIGLLKSENKLAEAETLLSDLLFQQRQSSGVQPLTVTLTLLQLANVLAAQNQADEAANRFREAWDIASHLRADATNAVSFNSVAWQLVTGEKPTKWDAAVAVELAQKTVAATDRKNPMILDTLAAAYASVGQFTNAVGVQQEAIALLPDEQRKKDYASRLALYQAGIPLHRDHAALARKVSALLVQGKFTEAEPPARECLALREKLMPDDWLTCNARSMLGGSLLGQKQYTEAEPLLVAAYDGMKLREDKIPANGKVRLHESLQRLVQLYEATGQTEKAAEWNRKLVEFDQAEAEKKTVAPKP